MAQSTKKAAIKTTHTKTVDEYLAAAPKDKRAALIKLLGLRGAMAWELSQDSNDHALVGALGPVLN